MRGQNKKYQDIQAIIFNELIKQGMKTETLAELSGVSERTITNFFKYEVKGTTDTICSMLEVLGLVERPKTDVFTKIKNCVDNDKVAFIHPETVRVWLKKKPYRIRWDMYLLLCDSADVDALEYWGS